MYPWVEVEPQCTLGWRWNLRVPLGGGGTSEYPWVEVEPQCTPGWRWNLRVPLGGGGTSVYPWVEVDGGGEGGGAVHYP